MERGKDMRDTVALSRYEDLLLGRRPHFYLTGSEAEKEKDAITIIHYILHDLLGWSGKDAADCLNDYIVEAMHIDKLISYIHFPAGINTEFNYHYIAYLAFPNEVKYDEGVEAIEIYKRVKNLTKPKFPKNFFSRTPVGYFRGQYLLKYCIAKETMLDANDVEKLFEYFANSAEVNKKLKSWKLSGACKSLYASDALKYLYDSLDKTPQVRFLYNSHMFDRIYSQAEWVYQKEKNDLQKK